jgi:hypothetical protein
MIHPVCRKQFEDFVTAVLKRAEMDESTFEVMERTGRSWEYIRKSIDYAMSEANESILELYKEFKKCECPLIKEERGEKHGRD